MVTWRDRSAAASRVAAKLAQYADLATAEDAPVLVLFWLLELAREAALRPALCGP